VYTPRKKVHPLLQSFAKEEPQLAEAESLMALSAGGAE